MAQVKNLIVNGITKIVNKVVAPEFVGKLTGKADTAGVADSANSVTWGNVSGKPSTYSPSSHTHAYTVNPYSSRQANINFSANTNGTGTMFHTVATSSCTTGKPSGDANILHINWDNAGGYDSQLALFTSTARDKFAV